MNTKALEKLESIVKPDLDLINENFIIKVDGKYQLFERYEVIPKKYSAEVKRFGNDMGSFSSTRSAVSWCIADKYNQLVLADDIQRLDQQRARIRTDVDAQEQILKKIRDKNHREILRLKLDTKKIILKDTEGRLDKCIGVAKYWQIRGFNNEIERTRRPAPNRTSIPRDRKSTRD
jgi:hypothetical protein